MGSFTEVVLGFSFRQDAPEHVLAAFSALALPSPPDPLAPPAPALPPPQEIDPDDDWAPDYQLVDPAADPEPWRHDWAGWFSQSMTVGITPSAQMIWSEMGRWTVSCRWGIKTWPGDVLPMLQWLGPFLVQSDHEPTLLGYMLHDDQLRPMLVWLTPQGAIEGEDLNEDLGAVE